jgi:hypothetical protein
LRVFYRREAGSGEESTESVHETDYEKNTGGNFLRRMVIMIERNYETRESLPGYTDSICITPCPFDPKGSFIGSLWCARCSHFISSLGKNKILCNCYAQGEFKGVIS